MNVSVFAVQWMLKCQHVILCCLNFLQEADLSNPDKDQDLEFGGSEREDIPRVGSNW